VRGGFLGGLLRRARFSIRPGGNRRQGADPTGQDQTG